MEDWLDAHVGLMSTSEGQGDKQARPSVKVTPAMVKEGMWHGGFLSLCSRKHYVGMCQCLKKGFVVYCLHELVLISIDVLVLHRFEIPF